MSYRMTRIAGHLLMCLGLCMAVVFGIMLFAVPDAQTTDFILPSSLSLGCAIVAFLFYRVSDEAGRRMRNDKSYSDLAIEITEEDAQFDDEDAQAVLEVSRWYAKRTWE